ncbi:MAG: M23 family metallopeptidase [Chloroflexota bacterium]
MMPRLSQIVMLTCLSLLLTLPSIAQESTSEPTPSPTPIPLTRPAVIAEADNTGLTLQRLFPSLLQGQVGLLRLTGDNIQEGRVLFRNREYPFYQGNDGWYAMVVADIDAQPRDYPLSVLIKQVDGTNISFADLITVESSGYIRQLFDVPASLGYLIDPAVERNEYARIDTLVTNPSQEFYWTDNVWSLPIDTGYSSSFGQYRILNQAVQTRHTGWDQSAPVGTPISTMMDGVITFAGDLDIRGQYILIDHGWGVYSGYAHLSQMTVEVGDSVEQGQLIGMSGNSGRSNGPHLHWEILVNGEWVDGVLFLETWLPS